MSAILILAAMLLALAPAAPALAYEGFGASTPGGSGQPDVEVTTLADSGPGSLREALAGGGNRRIVFTVGGEIVLGSFLYVTGPFVTIDGFTAPWPGITLRNQGLAIRGSKGAHDVIVRGIRVRDSSDDGIQVAFAAYNVVIDHVSIAGSADGDLDITEDSHDVTVSWSILAEPATGKTMLIKYNAARVSLHHNLFVKALSRNPVVSVNNGAPLAAEITVDMRNNVIANWGPGWGTKIHDGARANVVGNFYSSPESALLDQQEALLVCPSNCPDGPAAVYAEGNYSADLPGVDINLVGNEALPFPAAPVATGDACLSAYQVVAQAGVRALDARDQQYVAGVVLPPCVADLVADNLVAPASALAGSSITVTDTVQNVGSMTAEDFLVGLYLSRDRTLDAGDILLGSRAVSAVPASRRLAGSTTVTIPATTPAGSYSLVARVDAGEDVIELSESNNVRTRVIKVVVPDLTLSSLTSPNSGRAGDLFPISDTTENRGDGDAPASVTSFYLKDKAGLERYLGSRIVPPLAPSAKSSASTTVTLPSPLPVGTYSIVGRADADNIIIEKSETNNTRLRSISIK